MRERTPSDNVPYPTKRENALTENRHIEERGRFGKPAATPSDKISAPNLRPGDPDSLIQWTGLYMRIHVAGGSKRTEQAKTRDLDRFLRFFASEIGHDHVDGWTPSATKTFQRALESTVVEKTGKPYSATTINRVLATLRHFGRWLHGCRPLLAGSPFEGVRDLQTDEPEWNGLTGRQILRLKSACEQRLGLCTRADQNPLLEAAVFHCLLHTGLREFELAALDAGQYHHRGFHDVKRKGRKVSRKVPLPSEAREILDRYLATRSGVNDADPLFVSRFGRRISERDVARICDRIAGQACAQLDAKESFRLTPHMLRHTFLKRIADREGVHVAQKMSGNVSLREVFRYTRPSDEETEAIAEDAGL